MLVPPPPGVCSFPSDTPPSCAPASTPEHQGLEFANLNADVVVDDDDCTELDRDHADESIDLMWCPLIR